MAWLRLARVGLAVAIGGCTSPETTRDKDTQGPDDSGADTDTEDTGSDSDADTDTPPPPPVDADEDGHASDVDCDDEDPAVHPGAADAACDGVDLDCDGQDAPHGVLWQPDDGPLVDFTQQAEAALVTAPFTLTLDAPGLLRVCSEEIHAQLEVTAADVRVEGDRHRDGARPLVRTELANYLVRVTWDAELDLRDVELACDRCPTVVAVHGRLVSTDTLVRGSNTTSGYLLEGGSHLHLVGLEAKGVPRWVDHTPGHTDTTGRIERSRGLVGGALARALTLSGDWTLDDVQATGSGPLIFANGDLTIRDSDLANAGVATLVQHDGGVVVVEGSKLSSSAALLSSGRIEVRDSSLHYTGGVVRAQAPFAIYSLGADVVVERVGVVGFIDGGVIAWAGGTLALTDVTFSPGRTTRGSFGYYGYGGSQLHLEGDPDEPSRATCTRCTVADATRGPNAVVASLVGVGDGWDLAWIDGTCRDNDAGPCIQGVGGSLTVQGSRFEDNAHGALVGQVKALDVVDSTFARNTSDADGGAMDLRVFGGASASSIRRTVFVDNVATRHGGAVALEVRGGDVALADLTFRGNSAGEDGGAAHLISSTAGAWSVSGTVLFEDNSAQGEGGALAIEPDHDLTLGGLVLRRNTSAATCGSAIFADTRGIDISDHLVVEAAQFSQGADDNIPGDLRHPGKCIPLRFPGVATVSCSRTACAEGPAP